MAVSKFSAKEDKDNSEGSHLKRGGGRSQVFEGVAFETTAEQQHYMQQLQYQQQQQKKVRGAVLGAVGELIISSATHPFTLIQFHKETARKNVNN